MFLSPKKAAGVFVEFTIPWFIYMHDMTILPSRYWCRGCRVVCGAEELEMCYCLILTVTDSPTGTTVDVALFGRTLDWIFGLSAAQMHKYVQYSTACKKARSLCNYVFSHGGI